MAPKRSNKNKEEQKRNCEFDCSTTATFSRQWTEELVSNLKEHFSYINNSISCMNNSIQELKVCLKDDIKHIENVLMSSIREISTSVRETKSLAETNAAAIQELRCELNVLKCENAELRTQCNNVESYSRRDNIIFHGITYTDKESNEQCALAIRDFMKSSLRLDNDVVNAIRFVPCHRLGGRQNSPRPIIVRF